MAYWAMVAPLLLTTYRFLPSVGAAATSTIYQLRCFRPMLKASRLTYPSRAMTARSPKKQIHITAIAGVHVIIPAVARHPKATRITARPVAASPCLIAFRRSSATSLLGKVLRKRLGLPPNSRMRNPMPTNPTTAPANTPMILLLRPLGSEIARYPRETTMAMPPAVRSAERVFQSFISYPNSLLPISLFLRMHRPVNAEVNREFSASITRNPVSFRTLRMALPGASTPALPAWSAARRSTSRSVVLGYDQPWPPVPWFLRCQASCDSSV